ncbi:hypothetical protein KVT40_001937 [Elsinoe batatas]|uniref:Zn(2)-C6 fungal-type domain-containing protein n=1 Tax=Elsinoe batatas TaxID=2601811 RepID=A0A8K0L901_9PEZI|nr:hypothetical protein KVT40_001937 [Elsinoe batatas]
MLRASTPSRHYERQRRLGECCQLPPSGMRALSAAQSASIYSLPGAHRLTCRQIKCDRKVPCSSCKGLRIECRPAQKTTIPRTRTGSTGPASKAQTNPNTGTEISSECFAYARLALEAHVRYSKDFRSAQQLDTLDYVTWILLFHSFTPFDIHFTQTISTLDANDLALLGQAVEMLDTVKHVSKGSRRIYNVSKAFYDTAEALVQTQQAVQGLRQHDDGSLMFTEGLNTPSQPTTTAANWAAWSEAFPAVDSKSDMSMFLGNWLGDGRSVFDMLGLEGVEMLQQHQSM